ncbi:DUF2357 domain-containing protein [Ferruginivarius sediminum]|uniref:DUF2357 domain-containing protein n=1 Tax=Ferruginivarius sediminum TaxID=2661937 RepID=A0A369T5Q5_9PROT|nr:DUF2357 domain-containing protein [Ferruginivarius sediminum]RDD60608.1 DUF2357 domain-containing protein [Ferruginivarius sediminum]
MPAEVTLLLSPWALLGVSRDRVDLVPGQRHDVALTAMPVAFCSDDKPIQVDGHAHGAERLASFQTRLQEKQTLWLLPVPLKANAVQQIRHPSWESPASLQWANAVSKPRPGRSEMEEGRPDDGADWMAFLRRIVGRMADIDDALRECEDLWREVSERWRAPAAPRDPEMDILVRHAREYRRLWPDIAERPRRLLNRRRELLPLNRVQELDTRCMEWLSQQPGNNIPERAGGRQRILALARHENPNTLENRVFRDLLERTHAASRDYLRDRTRTRETERTRLVRSYGQECRRLAADAVESGVTSPPAHVQPNFVLQQDRRYRCVWKARQEMVQHGRTEDDLWQWQHHAWSEFCKVAVVVAVYNAGARGLIAASPLKYGVEHRLGRWLVHDDPLAIVLDRDNHLAIEVLDGAAPDLAPKVREFGAQIWLRIGRLNGEALHYLPIWTAHAFRNPPDLASLGESVQQTIDISRHQKLPVRAGIVLQSLVGPDAPAAIEETPHAAAIAFGPGQGQLANGLSLIAGSIADLVEVLA